MQEWLRCDKTHRDFATAPMNTVISATNPEKPGKPSEHNPATTNTVEMKGIIFMMPPS
jgi:hypothetical protein